MVTSAINGLIGEAQHAEQNDPLIGGLWPTIQQRFDLLDTPFIRMAMDPARTSIDLEAFNTSWYKRRTAERLRPVLSHSLVRAHWALVTITIRKLNI